jgi:hypothetical protein
MHHPRVRITALLPFALAVAVVLLAPSIGVVAGGPAPGNLIVSRSVYTGVASTVTVGAALPGGGIAVKDGTYPGVWDNETPDSSFGVTAPIFLDQMTTAGTVVDTIAVPTNQMVTSFSSKSELGLNLSQDGTAITFMGYATPAGVADGSNQLDVSQSNTPNHVDPGNPVTLVRQRAVGQLNLDGSVNVTPVNPYSGNNGRAAILGNGLYYLAGNAGGNGNGTLPLNVINNTGVQIGVPFVGGETTVVGAQGPCGPPVPANGCQFGFNITQLGLAPDKSGKDDNFRSTTIFNNTLYVTKGSGSNGVNTVYQVGTAGTLPNLASASTTPITILPGFPTSLARANSPAPRFPFAIWFANATTLYVADEGDGKAANAAADTLSGLQKWILVSGTWQRAYTLQNGLQLGAPYSVPTPAGRTPVPSPATDGLRNLTGRVNADHTVTIFAVTSTVSTLTDQGADANRIVMITDKIDAKTAADAATESFTTVRTANYGEVLRGVAFAGPFVVINNLSVTPSSIWPPNHKMVPVSLHVDVTGLQDPSPSCSLTGITSNEGSADDWEITGGLSAKVRAERAGNGGDRVYRFTVECTDSYGHTASQTVNATVPHDQGGGH